MEPSLLGYRGLQLSDGQNRMSTQVQEHRSANAVSSLQERAAWASWGYFDTRLEKSRPDQGAIYEHRGLVLTLDAAPYEDRSRRRRSECGERAGTARGGEYGDYIKPDRGIAKFPEHTLGRSTSL